MLVNKQVWSKPLSNDVFRQRVLAD